MPIPAGPQGEGVVPGTGVLQTQTGFCLCIIDQAITGNHLQLQKTKEATSGFAFFGEDFLSKNSVNISSLVQTCYQYASIYYHLSLTQGGFWRGGPCLAQVEVCEPLGTRHTW